ncbi:energy transducer TonB [Malikia sp.]|uniref:energy transducer TonB n=1 Tax=Malikia sp. TaxID=2070706 RepID=UPI0026338206|nr:energy transducer TonB [Malikia sp.]MDD2727811.1 energy transducer TonB [Malikia sp.]
MNPLRRLSPLQIALAVSGLAHAGLLMLHFVAPIEPERVLRESPLAVVLVNGQDEAAPEQPSAVAQANLAGSGSEGKGRVSSPLQNAERSQAGDSPDEADATGRRDHHQTARPLLASLRLRDAAQPLPRSPQEDASASDPERERRQQALLSRLAEIEQRINTEASGPRQRYIGAATREAVYASYYAELRRQIEARGTAEFPAVAGRKLFGELTLLITVDHEGRVLATELLQGSGSEALDLRAQALVRGMNFGRFDPTLRQQADRVVVASRFRFTRGGDAPGAW